MLHDLFQKSIQNFIYFCRREPSYNPLEVIDAGVDCVPVFVTDSYEVSSRLLEVPDGTLVLRLSGNAMGLLLRRQTLSCIRMPPLKIGGCRIAGPATLDPVGSHEILGAIIAEILVVLLRHFVYDGGREADLALSVPFRGA